jgi:hypothetical protein
MDTKVSNRIKRISEAVDFGKNIETSLKENRAYLIGRKVDEAKNRVIIVLNKYTESELAVYEDICLIEAIDLAIKRGVSVQFVFYQFEDYDELASLPIVKTLMSGIERGDLVECIFVYFKKSGPNHDTHSFVCFEDKSVVLTKNHPTGITEFFPDNFHMWKSFLGNFRYLRSFGEIIYF